MPRTHPPSLPAFWAEVVRLARSGEQSIPAIAADLGVSAEALRNWRRQADADAGRGQPGALTSVEREELRRLRREVKTLQQAWELLRTVAASCAQAPRCAATGAATRRGLSTPSPSAAGCWGSRDPATTIGRAAAVGEQPATTGGDTP